MSRFGNGGQVSVQRSCVSIALRWMQYIYAAELLNKRERRTEVSHEALIMHSHNCSVTVFVVVI